MIDNATVADDRLLLDAALEAIPYGFCVWSSSFQLLLWNRHYCDIYGFQPKRLHRGMSLEEVVRLSAELGNHPAQSPEDFLRGYTKQLLANRGGARAKSHETLAGGRLIETAHAYSPGLGWVVTHEDVTDEIARSETLQRRTAELERQNIRLDAAVNNISLGLCMHDAKGRLVICNQPYARIYKLPERFLRPGTSLDDILVYLFDHGMSTSSDRDSYMQWRHDTIKRGEYGKQIHELDGRSILMQHFPMKDGGWVSTHEDVTEQRQTEARIRHMARHDGLTDLPNRAQFLEEMDAIETQLTRGEQVAVLWIDLDHFKAINDTLGHAIGDALLKQVAARLWATTRDTDVLARLGGDQFALLLKPIEGPKEAALVADRVVKAIATPFAISGHQIVVSASVGIAMAPGDGMTTDALMKNADLATYRAKSDGRSTYHFFEPGMDATLQRRRVIEAGLRTALQSGQLRLAFQPLVGLAENRITCFEALLRWEHPQRGMISPVEFIPVAEDTGLIVQIGEWALREACRMAVHWPGQVRVAVNMSPVQFRNPRLFELVQAALGEAGLTPSRLELEITESLLLADSEQVLETLHRLRDLGVRIALDDFGTGYSSLSYLRSFPFDKIKIDRSFMRDLSRKGDSLAIIKAIIGLGHSLGMSLTAEGVETEEQLNAVREQGCNEVQGFLFSPPIASSAVQVLLDRSSAGAFGAAPKQSRTGTTTRRRG
ncbi:MAG: EAL domain-containing protein [Devosia sp.]|nr:EAL domain-containing protein [Devosia sp.]